MENSAENVSEQRQYFEQEDLPPQLLSFAETFKNGGDIEINDTSIAEYHRWMETVVDREKAYGGVWEHLDRQNDHLLSPLQINRHGREHANRVAGLTGLLYLSIRGPQKLEKIQKEKSLTEKNRAAHHVVRSLIAVAEPAGQMHDVGYSMHLKGKGFEEIRRVLSSDKQRAELPNHAEYGAQLVKHGFEQVCKDPSFYRKFFQEKYQKILLWKGGRYHDSLNQCVRAVRKHTSEQIKNPLTEQQTSGDLPLLVLCADKIDFTNRAPDSMKDEELFLDGPRVHQRVNAAILKQKVRVSQKDRHVELTLEIDPRIPESLAKKAGVKNIDYTKAQFKDEFFQTYGGSFEEIETIFKVHFTNNIAFNGKDLKHSAFSVILSFPDGVRFFRQFVGRRGERKMEKYAEELSGKFLAKMKKRA